MSVSPWTPLPATGLGRGGLPLRIILNFNSALRGPLPRKVLGEVWAARLVLDHFFGSRELGQRSVLCEYWPVVC